MPNKKLLIIIALLAILGIVLVWNKTRTKPLQEKGLYEDVSKDMIGLMKVKVPPVSKGEPVTLSALPSDLAETVRAGYTGFVASKVTYQIGGAGYRLNYFLPDRELKDLPNTFFLEILSKGVWQPLHIANSPVFSYFEIQNAKYEARVSLSPKLGKIFVTVEAVVK